MSFYLTVERGTLIQPELGEVNSNNISVDEVCISWQATRKHKRVYKKSAKFTRQRSCGSIILINDSYLVEMTSKQNTEYQVLQPESIQQSRN